MHDAVCRLPRTPLPGTWVNKGKMRKGRSLVNSGPLRFVLQGLGARIRNPMHRTLRVIFLQVVEGTTLLNL
jgi:hypothetical protein